MFVFISYETIKLGGTAHLLFLTAKTWKSVTLK